MCKRKDCQSWNNITDSSLEVAISRVFLAVSNVNHSDTGWFPYSCEFLTLFSGPDNLLLEWQHQVVNSRVVQAPCQNRYPHSCFWRFVRSTGDVLVNDQIESSAWQRPKCVTNRLFFIISGCVFLLAFCNDGKKEATIFSLFFVLLIIP